MTIIAIMAGFAFGYTVADLGINLYHSIKSKLNHDS